MKRAFYECAMKKTVKIAGVTALVVLAVTVALLRPRPTSKEVVLRLSGTPGLEVAGKVIVDGVASTLSASVPTNFTFSARSFSYRIKKTTVAGELKAACEIAGEFTLTSACTEAFAGVTGGAGYSGWLWPHPVNFVSTLLKEEAP
jgi:hypothetical protein